MEHAQRGEDYPTLCGIPAYEVEMYRHLFIGDGPDDCPECSRLVWDLPTVATMPVELADALDLVLHDLGPLAMHLRFEPDDQAGPEYDGIVVKFPDGGGAGIYVPTGDQAAQRLAWIADELQDVVVEWLPELGLPAVWPECPDHPDSHPLRVSDDQGTAVWICPRTGDRVGAIGHLTPGR